MLIAAAILTPPDVISQTFMALPTLMLYGVSILVSKRIEKRQAEAEEEGRVHEHRQDNRRALTISLRFIT